MTENTNCLSGMRCPKCEQNTRFHIVAETVVEVMDDGSVDIGNGHEWDENSACHCPECNFAATVDEFTEGRLAYNLSKEGKEL